MYSESIKKDIEEWRRIKKNRNKCSRKDKRQRKIAHHAHVFLGDQSAISLFLHFSYLHRTLLKCGKQPPPTFKGVLRKSLKCVNQ
jgi:hypothetical protein